MLCNILCASLKGSRMPIKHLFRSVMTRQYKVQIHQDIFSLSTYTTSPLHLDGEGNKEGGTEDFLSLQKLCCFIPFWGLWQLCWIWGSLVLPLWKIEMQQVASASASCQRLSSSTCNSLSTENNKTSTHWIKTNSSTLQHHWAMEDWKLCMSSFYPCSDPWNHALGKKKYIYIIFCTNSLCLSRNPKC